MPFNNDTVGFHNTLHPETVIEIQCSKLCADNILVIKSLTSKDLFV